MKKLFDPDSSLMIFLGRVGDLILLNALLDICLMTVALSGAAIVSLYQVLLKLVREEEASPLTAFLKSLRDNIKTSFPATIMLFVNLTGLGIVVRYLFMEELLFNPIIWMAISVFCLILTAVLSYLFPLLARFDNSFKGNLKNACLLVFRCPTTTLSLLAVNLLPLLCTTAFPERFTLWLGCWSFIGFAAGGYLNAGRLRNLFDKLSG